ncbi:response regulator [Brucella intermedia]|uniref:response regulator n=1 Tax=Brucella intermedia TaxID=94625 RepID=UPI001590E4F3|nr:response regulator [Brucella intermedia]
MKETVTVLIVDDESDLLEILRIALTDAGYDCITAGRAEIAMRLLSEAPHIDIILSDIRMPEIDGLALIEAIRRQFAERTWLQVLFITGHASIESAISALRLDAVDFLHKPIRQEQLLDAVSRAADRAKSQRATLQAWEEGQSNLMRLGEDVMRITEMLGKLPAGIQSGVDPEVKAVTPSVREKPAGRHRLLELLRLRETRQQYFADKLFADPVLHMLLELMEHHMHNRKVSVSALCESCGAPMTTAIRRLDDLEKAGFVTRWDDPKDGRRQFVKLTGSAVGKLTAYLNAIDRRLR